MANQVKRMCKTCWTLTQSAYGMWWYEQGCGKLRWKTLMKSNDAIHVQVNEGREDSNAKGINTLEVNDYLCALHDVWWCVELAIVMYKWP